MGKIKLSDNTYCYQSYKWTAHHSILSENVRGQFGSINIRTLQHKNALAAVFLIAKFCKQPKCALKGDWLNFDKLKQKNFIQSLKRTRCL